MNNVTIKSVKERHKSVRVKARVPAGLWGEVRVCAGAVGCSLEDWTFGVCRDFARGKFSVTNLEKLEMGTREGSVTPWVRVPVGFDVGSVNLRMALRAGVEYVRPLLFVPKPVVFNGFVISGRGDNLTVKALQATGGLQAGLEKQMESEAKQ